MTAVLRLYTRKECCLCDEMKTIVRGVAQTLLLRIEEIDVDSAPELRAEYGNDVPVLFINGRKAFKHRVTARELEKRLRRL